MNFRKLKNFVYPGIILDIEGADIHSLRASNEPGNDNSWREFTPERYTDEEELAAVINQTFRSDRIGDKEIYAGYK